MSKTSNLSVCLYTCARIGKIKEENQKKKGTIKKFTQSKLEGDILRPPPPTPRIIDTWFPQKLKIVHDSPKLSKKDKAFCTIMYIDKFEKKNRSGTDVVTEVDGRLLYY